MNARRVIALIAVILTPFTRGCTRVEVADAASEVRVEGELVILPTNSPQLAGLTTVVAGGGGVDSLEVPGRVVWDEDATVRVFSPFAGRVTSIRSDAGSVVRAGDTLALIASPDFGQAEANARRAATDFALAERVAVRTHDLFAHGVVARKDLEAADADLGRARTERQRAWALVTPYTTDTSGVDQLFALRAPLGGVIMDRSITPGQEVRPDQMLANAPQLVAPLFIVSDPSRMWVSLDLPERDVPDVRSGTTVLVYAASIPGRSFAARVTWVASAVDPATRTVKARAVVSNADGALRAEMLVTVVVPQPARRGMTVPSGAVLFKDGAHIVFVDEGGGRLRRCTVAIGGEHGGVLSLERGLTSGERVVTSGVLLLEQLYHTAGKS